MNCQLCFQSYDHSVREPFSLSCRHSFCFSCLDKLKTNQCPICKTKFKKKLPNIALLEIISESKYDKLKNESFKVLNEITEIKNDLKVKREAKLAASLELLKSVEQVIVNKTNQLIYLLKKNQQMHLNEIKVLKYEFKKSLAANPVENETDTKLASFKSYLDKNQFTDQILTKVENETSKLKENLKKLEAKVENFKTFEFVLKPNVNLNDGIMCEIKTDQKLFDKKILMGNEAKKNSRTNDAIKYYEEALEILPESTKPFYLKGNLLYELKNYQSALECFTKCIELEPTTHVFYLNKMHTLTELKKYEDVVQVSSKLIQLLPSVTAYQQRANALVMLQRHNEAIVAFNKAIKLDSNKALLHYSKGKCYISLGNYKEALSCFSKAVQLNDKNCEYINLKGVCLKNAKNYKGALKCFQKAIKLDPNYAQAYSSKGQCLIELKDYNGAIDALNIAIEIDPSNSVSKNFKASAILARSKKLDPIKE